MQADQVRNLGRPVRVVIVDDTRSIRAMIRALLATSPLIEVVGEAGDPFQARELIRSLDPDVITLDVVMPGMDGLSFLERLMRLRPMPVVMVSTRTTENSAEAVRALGLGAFDCVDLASLGRVTGPAINLAETVLAAAASNTRACFQRDRTPVVRVEPGDLDWNGRAVLIGSSTGGVDALLTVLSDFPRNGPPTLIAQHMPASFLESFARRLDNNIAPEVAIATDGAPLLQGKVYLAPGGTHHGTIVRDGPMRVRLRPDDGRAYVPSIDVLFSSGIRYGDKIVGVMLTGMGRDGAEALLGMRQAGAHTIVQDGASAVVDGMPRAAREIGAAVEVAPLSAIGGRIMASVSRQERARAT